MTAQTNYYLKGTLEDLAKKEKITLSLLLIHTRMDDGSVFMRLFNHFKRITCIFYEIILQGIVVQSQLVIEFEQCFMPVASSPTTITLHSSLWLAIYL